MEQLKETEAIHAASRGKCMDYLERVLAIVRRHKDGPLFSYDAALVADPLYFACLMVAECLGHEDDFKLCLNAMQQSKWAYARVEARRVNLQLIWDGRHERQVVEWNSAACSATDGSQSGRADRLDEATCGSGSRHKDTSESPIFPSTESTQSSPPCLHDFNIPAMILDGKEITSADNLANLTLPSKRMPGRGLEILASTEQSTFTLRPVTEFAECDDFVVPPNAMDDGEMTPQTHQLYETYTNGEYFLQ